ncbi:hypothetical protein [Mycoplasmopsis gallopavonis]|uniref:Uncharacterized protein n=1 Tax=Mycoplasmopsis gallopavonis TaxID=76629 RepID=A0A449B019_9BACT|nr:hypothetical protein [Mycoplasmopsis gallopavonis]RIV16149.1 hypothetical protein D1113_03335 [Mycoplasmopsis gallopavonis]VEU73101.1 Uncharacterised protein [Mycoplasmopsis gallopavonis]
MYSFFSSLQLGNAGEANRTIEDKKKDDLIKTLGYQNQTLKLELEKLNQNFNNNFVLLKSENDKLKKEIDKTTMNMIKLSQENDRKLKEVLDQKERLLSDLKQIKITELTYAQLVLKANQIIQKAISILKTFKEWTEVEDYEIHLPALNYDYSLRHSGYGTEVTPRWKEYADNLERFISVHPCKKLIKYKNNGAQIINEVLEVLKQWNLPESLNNQMTALINESN